MKDEKLWYRHSAMNEKANEGLVFYFDSSAAADSTIIHHSSFIVHSCICRAFAGFQTRPKMLYSTNLLQSG